MKLTTQELEVVIEKLKESTDIESGELNDRVAEEVIIEMERELSLRKLTIRNYQRFQELAKK